MNQPKMALGEKIETIVLRSVGGFNNGAIMGASGGTNPPRQTS